MFKWILVAFLTGIILWYIIFKTKIAIKSCRVVFDLRDQNAFNSVVDALAMQPFLLEASYVETSDTIVLDVHCLFFIYKKLKQKFESIPNTEVY